MAINILIYLSQRVKTYKNKHYKDKTLLEDRKKKRPPKLQHHSLREKPDDCLYVKISLRGWFTTRAKSLQCDC